MQSQKLMHAAIGILHDSNGRVLIQRRHKKQIYGDYWEFPGGKIEESETAAAAIQRELKEEIGIHVESPLPWLIRHHQYPHGTIVLHFFRLYKWRGDISGNEGQDIEWRSLQSPPPPQFLPANLPLWKWLRLPDIYVISAAEVIGVQPTLNLLPTLLAGGIRLLQLRDKNLPTEQRRALARAMAEQAHRYGALLLVNDDAALADEIGAAGIHLSSGKLMQCKSRPPFDWVAASCHSRDELQHAAALGVDFVVLSPVNKTLTHVNAPPLSWAGFAQLAQETPLPVYALGGMQQEDLPVARQHHAHGISMMRQAWRT